MSKDYERSDSGFYGKMILVETREMLVKEHDREFTNEEVMDGAVLDERRQEKLLDQTSALFPN